MWTNAGTCEGVYTVRGQEIYVETIEYAESCWVCMCQMFTALSQNVRMNKNECPRICAPANKYIHVRKFRSVNASANMPALCMPGRSTKITNLKIGEHLKAELRHPCWPTVTRINQGCHWPWQTCLVSKSVTVSWPAHKHGSPLSMWLDDCSRDSFFQTWAVIKINQ